VVEIEQLAIEKLEGETLRRKHHYLEGNSKREE